LPGSRRSFLAFPFVVPIGFDSRGRVTQSETRSVDGFADGLPHGAPPLELVQIPSGSLTDERGRQTLVSPFSLGRYEVTKQKWNAVEKKKKNR